jgi:molybdopterin converting factor small subunit
MAVVFFIPGPLRQFTGQQSAVELREPASTLREALGALWELCPGLRDRIVTEQGEVREHINIFVGSEDVRYTGELATRITSDCEISIVPAISGG